MKLISAAIPSCVLASTLILSGCATTPSGSSQAAAGPAQPTASTAQPAARTAVVEVPQLKVVTACGDCTVHETVPDLIRKGYANAADKAGIKVSAQSEATVSITGYTQRPPGLRVTFGALAGKDEIKATVSYQGKTFEVEDYFRNAWQGMNALSENIGEMVFEKIR